MMKETSQERKSGFWFNLKFLFGKKPEQKPKIKVQANLKLSATSNTDYAILNAPPKSKLKHSSQKEKKVAHSPLQYFVQEGDLAAIQNYMAENFIDAERLNTLCDLALDLFSAKDRIYLYLYAVKILHQNITKDNFGGVYAQFLTFKDQYDDMIRPILNTFYLPNRRVTGWVNEYYPNDDLQTRLFGLIIPDPRRQKQIAGIDSYEDSDSSYESKSV